MAQELPSGQYAADSYHTQTDQSCNASANVSATSLSPKDLNRHRLLARVHAFQIIGVLEQSLDGAVLIELGLQEQSDAIINPWRLIAQPAEQAVSSLPSDMHITQVYDQAEGELLILGAPGAGKTTLLLQLARDLLHRAEHDEGHPMPVVFNLSSWATKRLPLTEWLVEELNSKYQVPLKLGHEWVSQNQILPLLDGLDEAKQESWAACVEAINVYRRDHSLTPLVVCCRHADYDALGPSTRLWLHDAIVVEPLTAEQIDDYLASAGEKLSAVREVLHADPDLREMAATPLMLSVLTQAYADRRPDDLLDVSSALSRRQQLFATYVERMLQHQGTQAQYSPQQTKQWLSWLAKQMTQHGQSEFYLERMQPTWLSSGHRWFPFLFRVLVRVSIGVLFGIIACLALWLDYVLNALLNHSSFSMSSGVLFHGLLFGLAGGAIYGLVSPVETTIKPAETVVWSWKSFWQHSRKSKALQIGLIFAAAFAMVGILSIRISHSFELSWIYFVLFFSLLFGLLEGPIFRRLYESMEELSRNMQKEQTLAIRKHGIWQFVRNRILVGLIFGTVNGLISSFPFGLLIGMVAVLMREPQKNPHLLLLVPLICLLSAGAVIGVLSWLIFAVTSRVEIAFKPTKIFVWLARSIYRDLAKSEELPRWLVIVMIFGLFDRLAYGLDFRLSEELLDGLFWGGLYGLLGGLIFGLCNEIAGGLASRTMEEQTLIRPNQGIRRSVRNSAIVGLIFWLLSALIFWLFISVIREWKVLDGLRYGLSYGLISAVLIALPNGGVAYIQHRILRQLLRYTGSIPSHYTHFLNYTAEWLLLRRVGGGYIFIHRLLLEHFATQNSAPTSAKAVELGKWKERVFKINSFLLARIGLAIGILIIAVLPCTQPAWTPFVYPYPHPNARPILNDSLSANTGSWHETTDAFGRSRFIGGGYHVTSSKGFYYSPDEQIKFRNFTIEVEMTIVKGDYTILTFRNNETSRSYHGNEKSGSYYDLWIGRDGTYKLFSNKHNYAEWLPNIGGTSPNIRTGFRQPNVITVVAQGNSFNVYANHQYITTVSDPNSTSDQGSFDFGSASNNSAPSEALFRHVKIWRDK